MTGEARAESCARALGAGLTKPAFSEKRVTKPGWDPREMGSVWACTRAALQASIHVCPRRCCWKGAGCARTCSRNAHLPCSCSPAGSSCGPRDMRRAWWQHLSPQSAHAVSCSHQPLEWGATAESEYPTPEWRTLFPWSGFSFLLRLTAAV